MSDLRTLSDKLNPFQLPTECWHVLIRRLSLLAIRPFFHPLFVPWKCARSFSSSFWDLLFALLSRFKWLGASLLQIRTNLFAKVCLEVPNTELSESKRSAMLCSAKARAPSYTKPCTSLTPTRSSRSKPSFRMLWSRTERCTNASIVYHLLRIQKHQISQSSI